MLITIVANRMHFLGNCCLKGSHGDKNLGGELVGMVGIIPCADSKCTGPECIAAMKRLPTQTIDNNLEGEGGI
jgi:hypothetical protein